ncbi:hypothetical protein [Streptomyces sp. NPDC054804]
MLNSAGQGDGGAECCPAERTGGDGGGDGEWADAALGGLRESVDSEVRISTAGLEPADLRPASDFAAVLGESEATYGG